MVLFEKFRKQLQTTFTTSQISSIEQAYNFAALAHERQTRSSGEPYITHPLAVAGILAEMHMDSETLMAALLHDVVEDTGVPKEVIEEKFGSVVANLVDGVSKIEKIAFENKEEAQAENFRKMLLATAKDVRVILIKLADRLHNMSTLASLRVEKKKRIAQETLEIYVPLAKRLGMYNFYVDLENLCFQATHPQRCKILEKYVSKLRGRHQGVVDLISSAIEKELVQHPFSYLTVVGREKHIYGIYDKMRRKRVSLAAIMDVYGFRIIVESIEDCYRALGFIHNFYKPVAGRFKDYVAIPKANGYQSLHTTLLGPYGMPIEIQIRTKEMDKIAASGIAAHWIYKSPGTNGTNPLMGPDTQNWLKELVNVPHKVNPTEFIQHIKRDLSPTSTYVFTPKGEIIQLLHRATVIDFAYAVHSGIGNHCTAAKVNRHFVPLNTPLHSGNSVEIITSEQASPHPSWLEFVITSKARTHIRDFLKKRHHIDVSQAGKGLLEEALRTLDATPTNLTEKNIEKTLVSVNCSSMLELYHLIGSGEANSFLIAQQLLNDLDQNAAALVITDNVSIKSIENFPLKFSHCCYPIPYDEIVGILNSNNEVSVHSTNCPHVQYLRNSAEKFLALKWSTDIESYFTTELRVVICNKKGSLAKFIAQLFHFGLNIHGLKLLHNRDQHGKLKFTFSVKNRQELASIIQNIRSNPDILRVTRKMSGARTKI